MPVQGTLFGAPNPPLESCPFWEAGLKRSPRALVPLEAQVFLQRPVWRRIDEIWEARIMQETNSPKSSPQVDPELEVTQDRTSGQSAIPPPTSWRSRGRASNTKSPLENQTSTILGWGWSSVSELLSFFLTGQLCEDSPKRMGGERT